MSFRGARIRGGVDVDPLGDLDDEGSYIDTVGAVRVVPLQFGYGAKIDGCGIEHGPKCQVGLIDLCSPGSQFSPDSDDIDRFTRLDPENNGLFSVDASVRLAWVYCFQFCW